MQLDTNIFGIFWIGFKVEVNVVGAGDSYKVLINHGFLWGLRGRGGGIGLAGV